MQQTPFGTLPCGQSVEAHTLTNRNGAQLRVITYGGIVTSLRMPDRHGHLADVVLGFNELAPYLAGHPFFGAITGRVAGRIPHASFTLEGTTYQLARNDGDNHLHGGLTGLDKRLWQATPVPRADGADSLQLRYFSPDGEEGYPGNLDIRVTYTLTDANEFMIASEAVADRPTPLSLTHHSYFNLAGEGSGTIENHELWVDAELAIEMDDALAPTGRSLPVAGTAGDFRQTRRLGDAIPGLFQAHGNLYLVPRSPGESLVRIARVSDPASGRVLTISTTENCLQLYTSSALDGSIIGKSGSAYPRFAALALECEGYSNGVNQPDFGDILVRPGQPQRHLTVYAFTAC